MATFPVYLGIIILLITLEKNTHHLKFSKNLWQLVDILNFTKMTDFPVNLGTTECTKFFCPDQFWESKFFKKYLVSKFALAPIQLLLEKFFSENYKVFGAALLISKKFNQTKKI